MRLLRPRVTHLAWALFVCLFSLPAAAQDPARFAPEQLEQMLAPVALYPDTLLSQLLMASTYPADVAEAAKWSKAHPQQKGEAAVAAVSGQSWDPSVKSLVAFPDLLETLGAHPDWVQNLGDAFLASSRDVLDAVQRLRIQAEKAGHLKSSKQQKVVLEAEPDTAQTIVRIEPADPQVVYVPAYDPGVVYGDWPYPAYPPIYYPPSAYYYPGAALASGMMFGVGVAATAALWGNVNWGRGDVDIDVNRYNNINTNRQLDASQTSFQHNAAQRRGVPYRDEGSRQRFGSQDAGNPAQRSAYRGRTPEVEVQRQQAQAALQERGLSSDQARGEPRGGAARDDRAQERERERPKGGAERESRTAGNREPTRGSPEGRGDHALRGASDPAGTRQHIDRGESSRQSMTRQRSAAAPGAASRGAARGGLRR
ncbi:DUF3300 domain-containing protein [Aquabacterium sp. A7-Y]|uniref:DUF3300 domain-containing protein n=1 Tax=Aquabacterium sp. A7-Y TaxID=1349605 RepID=UPI00223E6175|nr:DUF3300 domain-containing protein [Aquabacterium sp. A7-Y]MCW7538556.1 DUF3300 domain-containing protein [Aquabacterium sp. A7-Y]